MKTNLSYLYLLSPLHTGGATQEGNIVGIAREVHTDLPYMPGAGLRGRVRASTPKEQQKFLWGNTLEDVQQNGDDNLTQGTIWIGDAAILWFPIPSLSHGIVWITSQFLLRRWLRLHNQSLSLPSPNSFSGGNREQLYLKDAIFEARELNSWSDWQQYIPQDNEITKTINKALLLSDQDCKVLIQTSLWQQVRVNLSEGKTLADNAGFRYEEAIPPETLMYFPWGTTTTANGNGDKAGNQLRQIFSQQDIWQFGGQESLGRGLVELWTPELTSTTTENPKIENTQVEISPTPPLQKPQRPNR
ncbi:type III-B CRISPR module RAMP protein Cmr4 [Anabaena sp. UHCC 0399]|uniref:type III-B CRISPR module RAMP protein Cmr4 n=1 Tax=Anabaena sp. UHCC 0399 TaxID=3110238 RepID=UPI002B217B2C|nr:type III-B CRISPR module RAMP protein Cmr4 [Anabaena sp. UHCC 0399]MEA5567624.1 type III-B CRISPR module RAMP protein Cmr4 [Anabaena sp. UHCC 0399]